MKNGNCNMVLSFMALFLTALALGCVSNTGMDITSIAKTMPEVKNFLNEYPNATIVVALWDNKTVSDNLASIQSDCGSQFSVGEYYRVSVSDPSLSLVVWLKKQNYEMVCTIRKPTSVAAKEEKGNVVEQQPSNISQPAESAGKIKDYCGNGKCDSGEDSTTCPKDCTTTSVPFCGNGQCDSGETIESCVADCGYEIYPYETDAKFCKDANGVNHSAKDANWFLYGDCGSKKFFHSIPEYKIIFYVYTDSCESCVCTHPNFYIYELINGTWTNMKYIDLPDEKGIGKHIVYTPVSYNVKIYATGCFFIKAYAESQQQNQSECKELYWFDNDVKECTKKKFCGFYMYYGLQTFASEEDCKAALPNVPSNLSAGNCYASVSSASGSMLTQRLITRGSCSDWSGYHQDFCIDGTNLKDYFCGPSSHANQSCLYTIFNCAEYGFNSCSEGSCTNITQIITTTAYNNYCNDTDGGMDYYVYGTAYSNGQSYSDHCNSDGTLTEKYCSGGSMSAITYACPYGCYEGRCNNYTNTTTTTIAIQYGNCSDTDWFGDGNSAYMARLATKGTCIDVTGSYNDTCIDGNQLRDYYCAPILQYPKYCDGNVVYSCTGNGFTGGCVNGACVNATTTTSSTTTSSTTTSTSTSTTIQYFCNDTDGLNFYSRGTVYYSYSYNYSSSNDTCANSTLLMEKYCNGTYPATYYYSCNCIDGACTNTTTTTSSTTTSTSTSTTTSSSTTTTVYYWCNNTDYSPNLTIMLMTNGPCIDNSGIYDDLCFGDIVIESYCGIGYMNRTMCMNATYACSSYGFSGGCSLGACTNYTG